MSVVRKLRLPYLKAPSLRETFALQPPYPTIQAVKQEGLGEAATQDCRLKLLLQALNGPGVN